MTEFPFEAICSLGIGGVFGLVVFLMYRKDRASSEEHIRQDRMFMEDRLNKIIDRDQSSREANTKALEGLVTILERLNGRIR